MSELSRQSTRDKPSSAEAFDRFARAIVAQDQNVVAALKTLSDRLGFLELVVWFDTLLLLVLGGRALHVW